MMLKPNEKATIARELSRFFKTYQSSRTIEPEAQVYFVEDAAEYSFDAVMDAIKLFRTGRAAGDRNDDFAPSVAAFVKQVRLCQEAIDVEGFWKKTGFAVQGSAEWLAICEVKGVRSMPAVDYRGADPALRGTVGWYVEKVELARHAALIAKHQKELLRLEARGPLRLADFHGAADGS